jgi:hypothetical protein
VDNNPYAPPRAIVEDKPAGADGLLRPPIVATAINMIWASLALGIGEMIVKLATVQIARVTLIAFLAGAAIGVLPQIWLNVKMAARRNWARVTYLVLEILGIAVVLAKPEQLTASPLISRAVFIVQTLLQLAACVLLLAPSASRWFKPANV